jgi:hypothetical protein
MKDKSFERRTANNLEVNCGGIMQVPDEVQLSYAGVTAALTLDSGPIRM